MNEHLKKAIGSGTVILLLGAGAVRECMNSNGSKLLLGDELARDMALNSGFEYNGEPLGQVYSASKRRDGVSVDRFIEKQYRNCRPSKACLTVAKFPWPRIYTINIDDSFEGAIRTSSSQCLEVCGISSYIKDIDVLYKRLDFVKLNGSVDRLHEGVIFSRQEYARGSSSPSSWYKEIAVDFYNYTFVFIGTTLNEPLLLHMLELYHSNSKPNKRLGYLISPEVSSINKEALLADYNVEHVVGTMESFAEWLVSSFDSIPSPMDTACVSDPCYAGMAKMTKEEKGFVYDVVKSIIPVNYAQACLNKKIYSEGEERNYYKGFKPTWGDIVDSVPAETHYLDLLNSSISKAVVSGDKLLMVVGPAGSGKTTLLMQSAMHFSVSVELPVYYLDSASDNIVDTIRTLEKLVDKKFLLFIDRIDDYKDSLASMLAEAGERKCLLISSESSNIWDKRVCSKLEKFSPIIVHVSSINNSDAVVVLNKIKEHGRWALLERMSQEERISVFMEKADRQLLIALLEVTRGRGYEEIIEEDYERINELDERLFFLLVGLSTISRSSIGEAQLSRALEYLNVDSSVDALASRLAGIIVSSGRRYKARHSLYVQHLFEKVVEKDLLKQAVLALLESYCRYKPPFITTLSKDEANTFKNVMNHKFLKRIFRSDYKAIIGIYRSFEKKFSVDGHYWLQYGLALRDSGEVYEAYDKLYVAYDVYPQPFSEHALALQEMIMALNTESSGKAFKLFEDAKEKLIRLDERKFVDGDSYPIVTLAEGHVKIFHKFKSLEDAQTVAKQYANTIHARIKDDVGNRRLREAWERLTSFAMSGKWSGRPIVKDC